MLTQLYHTLLYCAMAPALYCCTLHTLCMGHVLASIHAGYSPPHMHIVQLVLPLLVPSYILIMRKYSEAKGRGVHGSQYVSQYSRILGDPWAIPVWDIPLLWLWASWDTSYIQLFFRGQYVAVLDIPSTELNSGSSRLAA